MELLAVVDDGSRRRRRSQNLLRDKMSGKGKYAEKKLAKAAAVENTAKVHSTTAQAEKAESLATKTLSEDSVND